jgi:hypothetical protein
MNLLAEIRNWFAGNSKKKRRQFTRKASLKAGRYFWLGILRLQEEGTALAWLLTKKLSPVHRLCLNYLGERAIQGGLHANFLFREYPYSSHADLAGINRGIIEASVNYLYLLDDRSLERTAAFWAKSGFEESVRNDGLKKWLDSKNPMIKHMAQSDYEEKLKAFEIMLRAISRYTGVAKPNRGAWPNFKQRCRAVGEVWQFGVLMRNLC